MMSFVLMLFGLIVSVYMGIGSASVVILFFFFIISFIMMLDYGVEEVHVFGFGLGGDLMGIGLVLLSFFVLVMMIYSWLGKSMSMYLMLLMVIMGFILMLCFLVVSFLGFYLLFELVLIPTLVMIVGWGYQPERFGAGLYMLFYTIFCSVPLLLVILYEVLGSGGMEVCGLVHCMEGGTGLYLFIFIGLVSFLVSIPMFGVHLWLPSAHVEAPVVGSMILAGVLLSLGGYGMMRYLMHWWGLIWEVSIYFVVISLYGSVILALVCVKQSDLSGLVAYSSVVHMGLVVAGVMGGLSLGWVGGYALMVGHGFCSSGLFYYVGVIYGSLGSRSVLMNKGLVMVLPSGVVYWFMLVSSNMSFPPSLNLFGEVMLVGGLLAVYLVIFVLILVFSFLGGVYCLFMYGWMHHGDIYGGFSGVVEDNVMDSIIVLMHWLPLNMVFLKVDLFMI